MAVLQPRGSDESDAEASLLAPPLRAADGVLWLAATAASGLVRCPPDSPQGEAAVESDASAGPMVDETHQLQMV